MPSLPISSYNFKDDISYNSEKQALRRTLDSMEIDSSLRSMADRLGPCLLKPGIPNNRESRINLNYKHQPKGDSCYLTKSIIYPIGKKMVK